MDRRRFIRDASANLGAFALGMQLSSLGLLVQDPFPQESGTRQPDNLLAQHGDTREIDLVAAPTQFEIPTRGIFEKWLYNGQYPGPEIRVREAERLRLTVKNRLPEATTVHWHGIPVRNSMDGVPDITQPAIRTGEAFVYEFEAAPSGTFMYHSHFGLQSDRGLVGPLIIEEKSPHIAYDREHTLILTDFLRGAPVLLGGGMGHGDNPGGMLIPPYIGLLINGRPPEAPFVFNVKTGERVRMRLINPSGATIYRFAIGGHPLTVTHTDGRPVVPLRIDALHIAPGERYDILVEAGSPGAWPVVALPDNDLPPARAILRYSDSNELAPRDVALPEGLTRGRMLQLGELRGLDVPSSQKPNRTFNLTLSGRASRPGEMVGQVWTMGDQAYPNAAPLEVRQGEGVRIQLVNQSAMPHPIHMHGHYFRIGNVAKDTAIVWTHSGRVELDFIPNNPGAWLFHCHNVYHMEAGMARLIRYV